MLYFFDARIDTLTPEETIAQCETFLDSTSCHHITTVNPEMLVAARHDLMLRRILHNASLATIDGVGLYIILKLKNVTTHRFSGITLVTTLLFLSLEKKCRIAFVGNAHVHDAAAKILNEKKFDSVELKSFIAPEIQYRNGVLEGEWTQLLSDLHAFAPRVLLVGLGAGKQEAWIAREACQIPSIRIAVGVGGAFDMISGILPRAPVLFQCFGLEWLWRLLLEPRRITRIFRAVCVFPYLALSQKIKYE